MPANPEFLALITHTQTVARAIHDLYVAQHDARDAGDGDSEWQAAESLHNAVADLHAMTLKVARYLGRDAPQLIPVVQGEPAGDQPALPVPTTFGDDMLDAPEPTHQEKP